MQEKKSLTELAAQIESQQFNAEWAAHKDAHAAREAEQETAAFLSDPDYQAHQALAEATEAVQTVNASLDGIIAGELTTYGKRASADQIRFALENGGRAVVTLRSHKTGKHVTLTFVVRKQKPGGGWVSRATTAGRVGLADGDAIEVRDPELEYPDNYVGRYYLDNSAWKAGHSADGARVYAAERVLDLVLSGVVLHSEVFLAAQCSYCGHTLTDPESIERGIGPECYGKHTSSTMQKHGEVE